MEAPKTIQKTRKHGRKPLALEMFTYDVFDKVAIPKALDFLMSLLDGTDKDIQTVADYIRLKARVDAAKIIIAKLPDRIAGASGGELFPQLPTTTLERIILRHNDKKTLASGGDTIEEKTRVIEAYMAPGETIASEPVVVEVKQEDEQGTENNYFTTHDEKEASVSQESSIMHEVKQDDKLADDRNSDPADGVSIVIEENGQEGAKENEADKKE